MSEIRQVRKTLTSLNDETDRLTFNGGSGGPHHFSLATFGTFVGTVKLQVAEVGGSVWKDVPGSETSGTEDPVRGQLPGSFDMKAVMSAYTSGTPVVIVSR